MNAARMVPPPPCSGWRTGVVVTSSFVGIGIVVKEVDHLGALGDGGCRWFSIVLILLLVATGTAASPELARPPTAAAATTAATAVHRWN